jgi:hypothetical protein
MYDTLYLAEQLIFNSYCALLCCETVPSVTLNDIMLWLSC